MINVSDMFSMYNIVNKALIHQSILYDYRYIASRCKMNAPHSFDKEKKKKTFQAN